MKKIFILAGELSGDKNAAWYLQKLQNQNQNLVCYAFGGNFLQSVGAKIYRRFEELNLTGGLELLKHIPRVFKILNSTVDYILKNNFDEIILVDFPGFNLRVAKKLKKKNKDIKITYLAPPQTWAWGKGRINIMKKYCNKIVVLYPFEIDWYRSHGLNVEFLGNPVFDQTNKYFSKFSSREKTILLVPGSREHEINTLLPIFVDVAKRMQMKWRDINFVIPLAESIDKTSIEKKLRKLNFLNFSIVKNKREKFEVMSKSCMAISKPGTVAFELGLLSVPTVIAYKVSWFTYLLGRLLVKVKYMSLPNLIFDKEIFKEFVQVGCNSKTLFKHSADLYQSFLNSNSSYLNLQKDFKALKSLFNVKAEKRLKL